MRLVAVALSSTKAQASAVLRLTTLDLTSGEIRNHVSHLRNNGEFS